MPATPPSANPSDRQRLFLALLPPAAMQQTVRAIQQEMRDRYGSRAALNSPPHITLQAPFTYPTPEIPTLERHLAEFSAVRTTFAVALRNFAAFPPRVIYIDVLRSPELLTLQAELTAWLETRVGIIDARARSRAFTPHMTVAFRDLNAQNFEAARSEFQMRSLALDFWATSLTLLQHDGQGWQIARTFRFGNSC